MNCCKEIPLMIYNLASPWRWEFIKRHVSQVEVDLKHCFNLLITQLHSKSEELFIHKMSNYIFNIKKISAWAHQVSQCQQFIKPLTIIVHNRTNNPFAAVMFINESWGGHANVTSRSNNDRSRASRLLYTVKNL